MKNCELCDSKFGILNSKFVLDDGHIICTKCTILLGMIYKPDTLKYKKIPFDEIKKKYLDKINMPKVDTKDINEKSAQVLLCPNCNSVDVEFMQNNKKSFSVGKAVGGAALTGGIGTLAGFAGKKGNNQWHCKNCGTIFETKSK